MLIRNCVPADAEDEAAVYNAAAARLPGFSPVTAEQFRPSAGRTADHTTRLCAENDGRLVGYAAFEPTGRVYPPWCLPGFERVAHPLFGATLRALAERRVDRAFAACRADWADQVEFLEDHGFAKVREVVNFSQSIGELPTMFQRPGLNVALARPEDVPEFERLVPELLRLHGPALASHLFENPAIPAGALYVLRGKDGTIQGAGLLIDDATAAGVASLDPNNPISWTGAFGTEGLPGTRVNGLFSFLAASGKETLLIGQDLLWYGTSRMETNTFERLAAQAPTDAPHLLGFYDRYFERRGSFPVFERAIGSLSQF
jgi:hypothetical protein